MAIKQLTITNRFGEKLKAIKEYSDVKDSCPTVLLVPGLAMDLHEWDGGFDEIAEKLVNNGFLVYRFSFAGCGNSEGDFAEMTVTRQAKQVRDVLDYIRKDKLVDKANIGILAQSMGGPSTVEALPLDIRSLILFSAVFDVERSLVEVCKERNAYNPEGISYVPRSNGTTTPLGRELWSDIKSIHLKEKLIKHSPPAVLILHGAADDKVPVEDAEKYHGYAQKEKEIIIYPEGDHGLENPREVREKALEKIVEWFKETLI